MLNDAYATAAPYLQVVATLFRERTQGKLAALQSTVAGGKRGCCWAYKARLAGVEAGAQCFELGELHVRHSHARFVLAFHTAHGPSPRRRQADGAGPTGDGAALRHPLPNDWRRKRHCTRLLRGWAS